MDFSEYEVTMGGTWRLAGVGDYHWKYEYGWHIGRRCTGNDAITTVQDAIVKLNGSSTVVHWPNSFSTQRPARLRGSSWSGTAQMFNARAMMFRCMSDVPE